MLDCTRQPIGRLLAIRLDRPIWGANSRHRYSDLLAEKEIAQSRLLVDPRPAQHEQAQQLIEKGELDRSELRQLVLLIVDRQNPFRQFDHMLAAYPEAHRALASIVVPLATLARLGIFSFELARHFFNHSRCRGDQFRNLNFNHVPNPVLADREINVSQDIPCPADLSPGDFCVLCFETVRKILYPFANGLDMPQHCLEDVRIGFYFSASELALNSPRSSVLFPRCHQAAAGCYATFTASARILSLSLGCNV